MGSEIVNMVDFRCECADGFFFLCACGCFESLMLVMDGGIGAMSRFQ